MITVHLWRSYPVVPLFRYACTLQHDPEADSGYKIIDFEAGVADPGFLHQVGAHMAKARMSRSSYVEDGIRFETQDTVYPGEQDHFLDAAASVPGTYVRPIGREA